jgi:pimeloyl-ACP methyl ester carboxylesterase
VPGGGQPRHVGGGAARALAAAGLHAVALDLRGHGDSDWAPDGDYRLEAFAADLRAIAEALPRPPIVVGASLGGLTGLWAEAGGDPPPDGARSVLAALVLVDVAVTLNPSGVHRIVSFMRAHPDGFASLEEAADAIAGYLPHRPRPRDTSGLAKNLRRGTDGRYRWHWDPRFVERGGVADPGMAADALACAARRLRLPTLLVRGRMSDVLTEEAAREFSALAPHAEYHDVAGAAHMIAGDRNDAFTSAVVDFLRRRELTPR